MASVNRVTLIGNLGRDPEMRYLPSGEAVASFSVATTEKWKDKSGATQERTDWHRIEFIGRTAEVCGEYLKKGAPVYIEGRIQYDKWTDKEGQEKTMTKIRGDRMQMLGGRSGGGGDASYDDGGAPAPAPRAAPAGAPAGGAKKSKLDDFDDDIPF
jgi:single-strand DNA-binding protein